MANERTSLLSDALDDAASVSSSSVAAEGPKRIDGISKETLFLLGSSLPVSFSYALQNSLQTLSVIVVGHLGAFELSVAAFSYMLAMCTAWCVGLGGTTAIDTYASAVYTSGAPKTEVGIILQRCIISLALIYLPVAVVWWFISPVLLFLGQSPELSAACQTFLRVLSLGAPGYIAFEAVKKFLQVQGIMHASTYVLLFTSPFNVLLNYIFVYHMPLGSLGAPFATSITYWLSFFLLCAYAKYVQGSVCWGGWNAACINNLAPFTILAFQGILHVATEWWAFEIVALVAGHLGPVALGAQSVIMTMDQIMNTVPFGVGVASSARIGNLLGATRPKQAKLSSNASVLLASLLGLVILTLLMIFRKQFGFIFSDDKVVAELVSYVLPYVALFQIADGWAQSCGGVLRGIGKQRIGVAVNLVAYYLFALPLGVFLALKVDMGLKGLWIGQCVALFIVGIGQYIFVSLTDWDAEVEEARKRTTSVH